MSETFEFDARDESGAAANQGERVPLQVERQPKAQAAAMQLDASVNGDLHLSHYIKVLYKRRWLVGGAFAVVVASVAAYTYSAIPLFEAKSRLLIEVETPNVVAFKEVINEQQAKADYYQTQYNILQSRSLARKAMEQLGLFQGDALSGPPPKPGLWQRIKSWLGSTDPQVAAQSADETVAQSRAIDAFLRNLTVAPIRNSRLVDVKYRLPDPELATRIVNALSTAYIDQNLEYKFLASQEASSWLSDRLKEQRGQVEAAELALQRYREQNDAISLEDRQNITVQKLADLNAAVTRAKTTRIEKEALYSQLRSAQGSPALLDTFPAILGNGFVQQLKGQLADLQRQRAQMAERLGDKNPEMIKISSALQSTQVKLDAEIQKVVQSVKSEYDAAVSQEQSLTAALNQQKGEALAMNKKAIDYNVLERDVESSKGIYNSLMQRAKETGVAGELRTSNIRVVDFAERPRRPIFPDTRLNILSAVLGGGLLAVVLAFLFEYLDNRIKSPDEVKAYLGLAHLGLLPLMGKAPDGKEYSLLDGAVPASFSEAFRVLRTNILFSSTADGGQALVVTSTGPGEGKSLVASNLALSLAQAGRRVILLDADMRKPKTHTVFGIDQEPGLSNLLVGTTKASESVRKTQTNGLWVLPAGRIPPNPAELLGSKRFSDFLASLKGHFDWVIVDSPPVMAVADASVIAHLADAVLFVVGSEMTSHPNARRAVEQLKTAQGRVVGAVLNRVDLERNAYYYSQYYRKEYTSYYTKTS